MADTQRTSAILVLMSKIVNWGYAFVLNLRVKDVSNSFKLYRGDYLKELTLRCDNFDIVEEILLKSFANTRTVRSKNCLSVLSNACSEKQNVTSLNSFLLMWLLL